MKKFTKSLLREVKSGFGRFLAIMAIIALGVGFLIGIMQTTPDMRYTMDSFYKDSNVYDIQVKGTYGFTEKDIQSIIELKDDEGNALVSAAVPFFQTDVVALAGNKNVTARINGVDMSAAESDGFINRFTLKEGRLPVSADECVVEAANSNFQPIAVGDTVEIKTYGWLGDLYAVEKFTVTGIVTTPSYYYVDGREISTVGNGSVGAVLYVDESAYDLSDSPLSQLLSVEYTDCYLILADRDSYDFFTDKYENYVSESAAKVRALGTERNQSINKLIASFGYPQAEWYALDLPSTNVSYVSFSLNVDKVADIAGIFPVFFILVAALVALTSMTRMVEEGRSQIGALKSLGYSNLKIASKYLIYCLAASLVGCVLGLLGGFSLLPTILWQAYRTIYSLPALKLAFSPWFALAVLAICGALSVIVTAFACLSTLRERPSALLQPKAPKAGKRILLERVPLFWNRLSFKYKATVRNIFRYKKNMFMTVISVMGCTALILAGFGLNDSVNTVTQTQFNDIIKYDVSVGYGGEIAQDSALATFLNEAEGYASVYGEDAQIVLSGDKRSGTENVETVVVQDADALSPFIGFNAAEGEISWGGSSVLLSQNVAEDYGVHAGDPLIYRLNSGKEVELTVAGIAENYVGSYVYMSGDCYTQAFGEYKPNTLLVCAAVAEEDADALAERLLADGAESVSFTFHSKKTYDGLSDTMSFVIAVLVVSAGALAAIVLYNLININIEERRREIATLKVLGYRRPEVAGYIYRESAILTITGALLGLLLGWLLHIFLVKQINSVAMMFGAHIAWPSYIIAFLLTLLFAAAVYLLMVIKLNRVQMADSLKSNE